MEVSCSICCEEFHSNSQISSTRCGHVFHTSCIEGWMGRDVNATCPECNLCCNEIFKINLKFKNASENMQQSLEFQNQLDHSIKKCSEIQQLLDQSERDVLTFHEQIQLMQIELETLTDENEYLKIQTETKSQELSKKTDEIRRLRESFKQMCSLNDCDQQSQNDDDKIRTLSEELIVKERIIENLEDQLRNRSLELQNEIRKSAAHIYEKKKLQNLLDSQKNQKNEPVSTTPPFKSAAPRKCQSENVEKPTSIRISGFQEIKSPLEDIVIYLANIMGIACKNEDIANVMLLPAQNAYQNASTKEFSIMVHFKSNHLNEKFLTNKMKLNGNSTTANLRIFNHNRSVDKYELLTYTKKLRAIGFKFFFIKNGNVLARENSNSPFIKIYNMQQVDNMLKENSANFSAGKADDQRTPLFSTI